MGLVCCRGRCLTVELSNEGPPKSSHAILSTYSYGISPVIYLVSAPLSPAMATLALLKQMPSFLGYI